MQIAISLPLPIQLVGKTANAEYAISNKYVSLFTFVFLFLACTLSSDFFRSIHRVKYRTPAFSNTNHFGLGMRKLGAKKKDLTNKETKKDKKKLFKTNAHIRCERLNERENERA